MNDRPRVIRVEFGRGISQETYEAFFEAAQDLAEETMAKYPPDCDNEIWVLGDAASMNKNTEPEQPYGPGAFCGTCGHFAARHGLDGCAGVDGPCKCEVMQWQGYKWPRPWLPYPEGLRSE